MANPVLLRRQMVEIGRRLKQQNLIVSAEGNLSVRLGGRAFLVTPAGVGKGDLRVQDLLEIDAAGRCVRGRPSSEWPLHRRIYEARPDIAAICHAHPPWATAFAAAGRDLDGALLTETAALLGRVPVCPRAEPGTESAAASVLPHIRDHDAVLLGSHGAVTVGRDLGAAFALLETVERLAQVTLLAAIARGEGGALPPGLR